MHAPVNLAERTTLRVGGPADAWIRAESDPELVEAIRECDDAATPVLLLGGGSNLVVADSGFRGTVVEVATRGVVESRLHDRVTVTAMAGESWDEVVAAVVAQGWSGIEALSGIPGLCGATPIQNVGAYGQEVGQTISTVDVLDRMSGELLTLQTADCGFGYRTSIFKQHPGRWVVRSLTMTLQRSRFGVVRYAELARTLGVEISDCADVDEIRAAVLSLRRSKGMVLDSADHDTWSAGSFFTNPIVDADVRVPPDCPRYPAQAGVKVSAAWLIEHAGIERGFSLAEAPDAAISRKHTLAVTNRGKATATDVMRLARTVQARVRDTFGIDLSIEPTLVGDPD